jgi:thioredoxin-related protein
MSRFFRASILRFHALMLVAIVGLGLTSSARGADASIATIYLPRPAETVPGIRIGWYINDIKGAFQAAQSQNKLLVIVFREDRCGWCDLQLAHVFRCEAFNELAGRALFAIVSPSVDHDGAVLMNSLLIDSFPAMTVFDIKGRDIDERDRYIGYFPLSKILSVLKKTLMLGEGPLYTGSKAAKLATEI